MKQTDIRKFLEGVGLTPSDAQIDQVLTYEGLVEARGAEFGVVSRLDIPRLRERHILDCARATALAPYRGVAYDLGSGAGLPGILIAILRPGLRVSLVERRARRVAFLEWVGQELGLGNAVVEAGVIDALPAASADCCFARALAPLVASWAAARPLLKPAGELVYFAGSSTEVPARLPDASRLRTVACEMLESAGPLVIITR